MLRGYDDVIVKTATRILVPHLQIYSLYVLVHGHSSPGGGFQGGCIMAASFILLAVVYGLPDVKTRLRERAGIIFCSLGVFIYTSTGIVSFFYSGNFLDYSKWSNILHVAPVMARYYGMAFIEAGVFITVMAVMISIFLDVSTQGRHEGATENESAGNNHKS